MHLELNIMLNGVHMIKVELTGTECRLLQHIGILRNEQTGRVAKEQIQSKLNPLQISIDGALSEYMVAKHFGYFFDINCDVRKFGADLFTKTKMSIDVKSTRNPNGVMSIRKQMDESKQNKYDIYILVELDKENNGYIIGWIYGDDAIHESNIHQIEQREPYYKITREQLTQF